MSQLQSYAPAQQADLPQGLLDNLEISQVRQIFANTRIEGNSKVHMGNAYNYYVNLAKHQYFHELSDEQSAAMVRRALYYCTIDDRKAEILRAKPETLSWIWSTDFGTWLNNPDAPVFWISGKPASGKSTLMKYLVTHGETSKRLSSCGHDWVLIHFFFDFQAGTEISNSRLGLVRSMIVQLVTKFPRYAEEVYCGDLSQLDGNLPNLTENLESALNLIIEKVGKGIVAFIDGLDEYKGDMPELIRYLLELSQIEKLKVCLASRPEVLISRFLSTHPGIIMQNWNTRVIYSYYQVAAHGLLDPPDMGRLRDKFLPTIAKRADGVLLWARYVIDQIIQRSARGETDSELETTLRDVPSKLDAIYERMLSRMLPAQKAQAALLLALLTKSAATFERPNLQSLRRRFGDEAVLHLDLVHLLWMAGLRKCCILRPNDTLLSGSFRFRIHAMFDGFIEFSEKKTRIHRFHKTFADYLVRTEWVDKHLPVQLSSIPSHLLSAFLAAEVITAASEAVDSSKHYMYLERFELEKYHRIRDSQRHLEMLQSFLGHILPGEWAQQVDGLAYAMQYMSYRIADLDTANQNMIVRTALKENLDCLLSRYYPNRFWHWVQRSSRLERALPSEPHRGPVDIRRFSIENQSLFHALQFSATNYFSDNFSKLGQSLDAKQIDTLIWLTLGQTPKHGPSRIVLPQILSNIYIEPHHVALLMSGELEDVYDEVPLWFHQLMRDHLTSPSWRREIDMGLVWIFAAWSGGEMKHSSHHAVFLNKILEFGVLVKDSLSRSLINVLRSMHFRHSPLNRKLKIMLLLENGAEVSEMVIDTAEERYQYRETKEEGREFEDILQLLRDHRS